MREKLSLEFPFYTVTLNTSMRRLIDPFYKSPMIRMVIFINVGVFLGWQFAFMDGNPYFMAKNFLTSYVSLEEGRYWTLLTSVFSHNSFFHIFINMFVLNSFGPIVTQLTGRKSFIKFYLTAGIVGSLVHCLTSEFFLAQPYLNALGASGAIAGVILVFSLLFPKQKILLLGIIPVGAIWGAMIFIGLDLWGLIAQTKGGGLPIGHGAHLGGAFTGVAYYFIVRKK